MSTKRTILDFPRNEAGLVDEFIGTAYDVVYKIYQNLEEILLTGGHAASAKASAEAAKASELAAKLSEQNASASEQAAAQHAAQVAQGVAEAIAARDMAEASAILALSYLELVQAGVIQVTADKQEVVRLAGEAAGSAQSAAESAASVNATETPAPNRIPKSGGTGTLDAGWLPPNIQAAPAEIAIVTDHTIYALKEGADNTGATSASAALTQAWTKVRAVVDAGWTMAPIAFVIAPGVYLIDEPIDFGAIYAWNVTIDAVGAVFLCATPGKISVDMSGCRGAKVRGLSLFGDQARMPLAGLLLGPSDADVCGNNSFESLKADGYWERTPVWNMGSETTDWSFCYFVNRHNAVDSWCFLGDAFNNWTVTSPFRSIRPNMTWASLTCNSFKACRFAHHGGKSPVYLDGVFHWTFDMNCYFLTWGTAGITIRCRDQARRNVNLEIKGLFESGGASMYGGLDDCVRIVCDNGINTAIEGFILNAGQPQSKRAVIRVETPDGTPMTTGMVKVSGLDLKISRTINAGSVTKLFSGARLMLNGSINCRDSLLVNLEALQGFQGILYTEDYSKITKPTTSLPFSVMVFDEVTNGGRAVTIAGVGAADLDLIAGATPQLKVSGVADNVDLSLLAKGASGKLKLDSGAIAALPFELPTYTKASLPAAASWLRGTVVVSDATGGAAICRSNGTNWIDFKTQTTVV